MEFRESMWVYPLGFLSIAMLLEYSQDKSPLRRRKSTEKCKNYERRDVNATLIIINDKYLIHITSPFFF